MKSNILPENVVRALQKFARYEGRYWKSRLSTAWVLGKDLSWACEQGWELQYARNVLGPSGLYNLRLDVDFYK